MYKNYLLLLFTAVLLASCSQNEQNKEKKEEPPKQGEQAKATNTRSPNTNIDEKENYVLDLKAQYKESGKKSSINSIKLIVDGSLLTTKPSPVIEGEDLYIPLSYVSTHFETGVLFSKNSETVGFHKGNTDIDMAFNSKTAKVNGVQVASPPIIKKKKGDIYVPIGFLAENLGYSVEKNIQEKEVRIETHEPVNDLPTLGELKTNNIDELVIPVQAIPQKTYKVRKGDTLSSIAKRNKLTVGELKSINKLKSNTIRVGQVLKVTKPTTSNSALPKKATPPIKKAPPTVKEEPGKPSPTIEKSPTTQSVPTGEKTYTVVSGDSLFSISKKFNVPMDQIRSKNALTSDVIKLGQNLIIPEQGITQPEEGTQPTPAAKPEQVSVTYVTHTVNTGDNLWNLSVKYGIPMLELARENNLSINNSLSIGQQIIVPVYSVPIKPVVSSKHGELLGWWTEARYAFPIGSEATITDYKTGRTFKVKHTMGGNHADAEPLTAYDAGIMKEIWGGKYSWTPRAVIVSFNGRRLAAAMHSYPHSIESIKDENNYNGHFCIHFLNSTRHKDGLVQESMQKQIKIAAGVN